ncbi:MAG: DNA polymerase Y family protein [Acidiferrobacterales bacterium]
MLWLCIHLPQLPLEVFSRSTNDAAHPAATRAGGRAVCAGGTGTKARILVCDSRAAILGIRPGMSLGAACTLTNKLTLYPRDEVLEQEALGHIAAWATQFSSLVSIAAPQAVLLEVAGSLTLFGSLDRVQETAKKGLSELGYHAVLAVAPTPLSALWLGRSGKPVTVTRPSQLSTVVGRLSLNYLQLSERKRRSLDGMGLRCIADLLRLPRDGLTRRMGKDLLSLLDRATGKAPDPQKLYVAPLRFRSRLLLPAEADNIEALLFAIHRLVAELGGMLLGCGAGVQELSIQLVHREQQINRASKDVTHVDLKLAAPNRDPDHFMAVLRERLERVTLVAPVIEIVMAADTILPLASHAQDLFTRKGESEQNWQSLLERLHARLGDDAVHGLRQVAEHRPEYAWENVAVGSSGTAAKFSKRPFWLLSEPVPLDCHNVDLPYFRGPLQIDTDRERIESGWWDGNDIARDYFVARNPRGLQLWIFRELRGERRWFLHGIFG